MCQVMASALYMCYLISHNPYFRYVWWIIPFLQVKRLRLREIDYQAQGHTAGSGHPCHSFSCAWDLHLSPWAGLTSIPWWIVQMATLGFSLETALIFLLIPLHLLLSFLVPEPDSDKPFWPPLFRWASELCWTSPYSILVWPYSWFCGLSYLDYK